MKTDKDLLNSVLELKAKMEKSNIILDDEEIKKIFPVGSVWKIFYSVGNWNNKKMYVVAVAENQVVYRHWGKHKKRWFYTIDSAYSLFLTFETGHLFRVKQGNEKFCSACTVFSEEGAHSACAKLCEFLTENHFAELGDSVSRAVKKLGFNFCPFCGVKTMNNEKGE